MTNSDQQAIKLLEEANVHIVKAFKMLFDFQDLLEALDIKEDPQTLLTKLTNSSWQIDEMILQMQVKNSKKVAK